MQSNTVRQDYWYIRKESNLTTVFQESELYQCRQRKENGIFTIFLIAAARNVQKLHKNDIITHSIALQYCNAFQ